MHVHLLVVTKQQSCIKIQVVCVTGCLMLPYGHQYRPCRAHAVLSDVCNCVLVQNEGESLASFPVSTASCFFAQWKKNNTKKQNKARESYLNISQFCME